MMLKIMLSNCRKQVTITLKDKGKVVGKLDVLRSYIKINMELVNLIFL